MTKIENYLRLSDRQRLIMAIIQARLKEKKRDEALFTLDFLVKTINAELMGGKATSSTTSTNLTSLEKKGYIKRTYTRTPLKHGGLNMKIKLIMPTRTCTCK